MTRYENARWQLRRNTAIRWTILNPILLSGEQGYEMDTGKLKIGDGFLPWNDLEYFSGGTDTVIIGDGVTIEQVDDRIEEHVVSELPHPEYDFGPSLVLLYNNAKV